MKAKEAYSPIRRILSDAAMGLFAFAILAFGLTGGLPFEGLGAHRVVAAELTRAPAATAPLASASAVKPAAAVPGTRMTEGADLRDGASRAVTATLLGVLFAVLFAFNLTFFRHLHRVYVAPTRRRRLGRTGGP